ncbi:macro domain-containing protein RSc0334-like isoform X2 [Leptopilina heterotoma]|uniref:macro domain-containing protein RSc0334-like isoform X2 n=1 Tax=Leptopilina heterotoma TaxID=63436 RepID=UPI001CA8E685|nr:macro domain-containing protein RSc0334-like isoform X2 [Leptopilina heterotoma]
MYYLNKLTNSFQSARRMSFAEEKKKFLTMSTEEKRQHFNGQIVTLNEVETWRKFWENNKSNIAKTKEEIELVDATLAEKISLWQGDITSLEIDAIVNAANSTLLGGGGVDGAIHKAAGPTLKKECATLGGCRVGEAKITGGYKLPAKHVIHTVGPQGEKPDKLKDCYKHSLKLMKENDLRTIAFPCISTGIYGYPQRPAAKVALAAVKKFLIEHNEHIDRIIFCVFLPDDKEYYMDLLQKYFGLE